MRPILAALVCGVLFGAGLALAGMTDPRVVVGFLDIAGEWNPALAFVMAGALIVAAVGFRLVLRTQRPILAARFSLPTAKQLDLQLIGGAAAFGVGWGLAGYCPGPAIASLSALNPGTLVFAAAMLLGLSLAKRLRAPPEGRRAAVASH